jgi:hypothetical protein
MKHCHGDDACPDDRRRSDAERDHLRTLTQERRTFVHQPVAGRRTTSSVRGVRHRSRLRLDELTALRRGVGRGVNCVNRFRGRGRPERGYLRWQPVIFPVPTRICPHQLGRGRRCPASLGRALAILRLARTFAFDRPGSTGARGASDRLVPALRRRFVRGCARTATPTGDSPHGSRSAGRRARLTPLIRHESPVSPSAPRTRPNAGP